nr:photosystem II reaction center PSB28 [Hymenophyllum caudiculatum]
MMAMCSVTCSPASSHSLQQQQQQQTSPFRPFSSGLATSSSVLHCGSTKSSFIGLHSRLAGCAWVRVSSVRPVRPTVVMSKPSIQFIKGIDEQTVPDVSLTRSKDGTNGVAMFLFDQPSIFDSSRELGDITGIYMIDEEGVLQSVDVSAKFVNGKPAKIEARYIMRTIRDWDRFMRFMERYAEANGLGFVKK